MENMLAVCVIIISVGIVYTLFKYDEMESLRQQNEITIKMHNETRYQLYLYTKYSEYTYSYGKDFLQSFTEWKDIHKKEHKADFKIFFAGNNYDEEKKII